MLLLALAAPGWALFLIPLWPHPHPPGSDFIPLYAASKLLGTPDLYVPEVFYRTEIAVTGLYPRDVLIFTRPPFVAALAWPLSLLPYEPAHALWFILRVLAVLGFIAIWPVRWPDLGRLPAILAVGWSFPLSFALLNGQDSPFLLLWMAVAERFHDRRPWVAGLALALCMAKYHLFLLLPVFLLVHRRRLIPGFLAGCGALAGLSFAVAGLNWPRAYLALLRLPVVIADVQIMPNIHGLMLPFTGEVALCIVVAVLAIAGILRLNASLALAVTLSASFLLSYHAYFADLTVLLPAALLLAAGIARRRSPQAATAAA